MSNPAIVSSPGHRPVDRPPVDHSARRISSGPISAGIIQLNPNQMSNALDTHNRHASERRPRAANEHTEHVCMFSVCLMFVGVPVIVVGIIFLSFFSPVGVTLIVVGIVASSSGAILAIVSAILTIFIKKPVPNTNTSSAGTEYMTGTPNRATHHDVYNNVPTIVVPQMTNNSQPRRESDQSWTNYPNAQNPRSYLDSFGDLPKVIPSPQPSLGPSMEIRGSVRSAETRSRKKRFDKKKGRSSAGVKLPAAIKIGSKGKSLSKAELIRDESIEVIHSSSRSSSSTSTPLSSRPGSPTVTVSATKTSIVVANSESGEQSDKNNIVTIESFEVNICETDGRPDGEIVVTSNDGVSDEFERVEERSDQRLGDSLAVNSGADLMSGGNAVSVANGKHGNKWKNVSNEETRI